MTEPEASETVEETTEAEVAEETEEEPEAAEEAEEELKEEEVFDTEPQELTAVVGLAKAIVKYDPGVFPAGCTLSVRVVSASEKAAVESAVDRVRDASKNVAASYTYDVTVYDKEFAGQVVQVQFDAYTIRQEGYLTATLSATVGSQTTKIYIEFMNYNDLRLGLNHIELRDVEDPHTVPEFVNVRNTLAEDGYTLQPEIDIEVVN